MGLYHEFQTGITFANLPFVQIHVYKFEMIIATKLLSQRI